MRTALVALLLSFAAGPLIWADTTPVGQPIPFSHKQHAETAHLKCDDCHKLAPSGEVVSIPTGKSCMACHGHIDVHSPAIKDLRAYVDEDQSVPWVRVYEIPSFVEFSHKVHLDAGTTCEACHGHVAVRDRLCRESDLSMAGCISCHRQRAANADCHSCHNLEE